MDSLDCPQQSMDLFWGSPWISVHGLLLKEIFSWTGDGLGMDCPWTRNENLGGVFTKNNYTQNWVDSPWTVHGLQAVHGCPRDYVGECKVLPSRKPLPTPKCEQASPWTGFSTNPLSCRPVSLNVHSGRTSPCPKARADGRVHWSPRNNNT